jgi:DNA-binding XRE family transcriptional regulator
VAKKPTRGNEYAAQINETGERVSQLARRLDIAAQTIHAALEAAGLEVQCVVVPKRTGRKLPRTRAQSISPEEALRRNLMIEERAQILVRLMRGEIHQRPAAKLAGVSRRTITAWLKPSGSKVRNRALEIIEKQNAASP